MPDTSAVYPGQEINASPKSRCPNQDTVSLSLSTPPLTLAVLEQFAPMAMPCQSSLASFPLGSEGDGFTQGPGNVTTYFVKTRRDYFDSRNNRVKGNQRAGKEKETLSFTYNHKE